MMCGIFGLISTKVIEPSVVENSTDVMVHRGPDDKGYLILNEKNLNVGLGHRRLSIIDLTPAGHQPMSNEDKSSWIIHNGEIYNFRELREELKDRGHFFTSRTDTEVIIHAYEEWGEECLHKLHGMFAFAIWDRNNKTLFLARDPLGIKPLYYAVKPQHWFVFSSEIKSLLQTGLIAPEVNFEALNCYLTFLWVPDPNTMFNNIYKLFPGNYLVYKDGKTKIKQYWDLNFNILPHHKQDFWVECMLREIDRSIRTNLESDVPLGALLSGGLDSSSVVALMANALKDPIPTYTIAFRETDIREDILMDEAQYARLVGGIFKTDYTEITVKPEAALLLPKLVWHMDEPIADPAAISTYMICNAAKEKLTVMLSGMGGDELFAGYPRHFAALCAEYYSKIPKFMRTTILEALTRSIPINGPLPIRRTIRNLKKFMINASLPFNHRYLGFGTYFSRDDKRNLLSKDFVDILSKSDPYKQHLKYLYQVKDQHLINQMLYLDLKTFLPCLNLAYTDKMSMAASVEIRVPYLDTQFVELSASIPPQFKLKKGIRKYILKKMASRILPPEIVWRKKSGFAAPVGAWIKNELEEMIMDLLSKRAVRERRYFNYPAVKKLLDDHYSGREYNALQIWQLLTLEVWHLVFVDKRWSVS